MSGGDFFVSRIFLLPKPPFGGAMVRKSLQQKQVPVNEEIQEDTKHIERFRKTLRAAIEPSKVVTNAAVRTLDEMSLCLSHRVRFRNFHSSESDIVTTVSVRVYVSNIWPETLD